MKHCGKCKEHSFHKLCDNPCDKKIDECGCSHYHHLKCLLYEGPDVPDLDIYNGMSGIELIAAIISYISSLEDEEKEIYFKNLGNGKEVYKEFDGLRFLFRSINGSESIDVDYGNNSSEIVVSINEEYLLSIIGDEIGNLLFSTNNIIKEIQVNTNEPIHEYVNNLATPIEVDKDTNLVINNNNTELYFLKLGKGRYGGTYTQVSADDFLKIKTDFTNTVIKNTNVQRAVPLVKSPNGDTYEIKRLKSETLDLKDEGDYISLEYIPKEEKLGVRAFYVNEGYDGDNPDGTIIKPFKSWEACKQAVIGSGTYYNPEFKNVRVVFQSDITTTENLTLNYTTFQFEDIFFKYVGDESKPIIDMREFASIIIEDLENDTDYRIFDSSIVLKGKARINKVSDNNQEVFVVSGIFNKERYDRLYTRYLSKNIRPGTSLVIQGDIFVQQSEPSDSEMRSQYSLAYTNAANNDVYKNDAGAQIYVTKKKLPNAIVSGYNQNKPLGRALFLDNGHLTIETINTTPIKLKDSIAVLTGQDARIDININTKYYLYGNRTVVDGNYDYKPNDSFNAIHLDGGVLGSPKRGETIESTLWGSRDDLGGFNAFVKMETKTDSMNDSRINISNMAVSTKRFNHFVDLSYNYTGERQSPMTVDVDNIYYISNSNGEFIESPTLITSKNFNLFLGGGKINSEFTVNSSTIITQGTPLHYFIYLKGIDINGKYTDNTLSVFDRDDLAAAAGLIPGSFYKDSQGFLRVKQ